MGRSSGYYADINPKQKLFADEYMKTGNAKEAALNAGYSVENAKKTAHNIINKPNVQNYIIEQQDAMQEKVDVTFEWASKKVKNIVDTRTEEGYTNEDAKIALDGIKVANVMFGFNSAEKRVNVNVAIDPDVARVNELIEKYKRDY